ncbi:hypothetical protein C8R43DRAFT_943847 [Mycena crocata]|nr:hypothetical protein C8R43DRAFT_943847 [Mycena crocata]
MSTVSRGGKTTMQHLYNMVHGSRRRNETTVLNMGSEAVSEARNDGRQCNIITRWSMAAFEHHMMTTYRSGEILDLGWCIQAINKPVERMVLLSKIRIWMKGTRDKPRMIYIMDKARGNTLTCEGGCNAPIATMVKQRRGGRRRQARWGKGRELFDAVGKLVGDFNQNVSSMSEKIKGSIWGKLPKELFPDEYESTILRLIENGVVTEISEGVGHPTLPHRFDISATLNLPTQDNPVHYRLKFNTQYRSPRSNPQLESKKQTVDALQVANYFNTERSPFTLNALSSSTNFKPRQLPQPKT